jgi:hypothetical protein
LRRLARSPAGHGATTRPAGSPDHRCAAHPPRQRYRANPRRRPQPSARTQARHLDPHRRGLRDCGFGRSSQQQFAECLYWSLPCRVLRGGVELGGDDVQAGLCCARQAGALGEVLAEQAVGVLIRSPLPRSSGQSGLRCSRRSSDLAGLSGLTGAALKVAEEFLVADGRRRLRGPGGADRARRPVRKGGWASRPGAVFFDDRAQLNPPVEGGLAGPGAGCDFGNRQGAWRHERGPCHAAQLGDRLNITGEFR